MSEKKVLGILGGGGPAPGMNAVLCAAALYAMDEGWEVVGIRDGFSHLMKGDVDNAFQDLVEFEVTRLHNKGGFYLGLARSNPTKSPELLNTVADTLKKRGITHLICIGGDDTNTSAAHLALKTDMACLGIPKTIDNDIGILPQDTPTFGYRTAVHYGDLYAQNYQRDGKSVGRWYFLVVMGRAAGYITQGISNSVSATVSLIPEEIPKDTPLQTIIDLIAGAIIKRHAMGRNHGLLLVGEGVIEKVRKEDIMGLKGAEVDDHGHIRYAEVDFAGLLRNRVKDVLVELDVPVTITSENLGYIMRCNPPVGFDKEYCRKLGWGAFDYFLRGGKNALITVQNGQVVPIPFEKALNERGRIPNREISTDSVEYRMSLTYQIRLMKRDFHNKEFLDKMVSMTNITEDKFTKRFGPLAGLDVGTGARTEYDWVGK